MFFQIAFLRLRNFFPWKTKFVKTSSCITKENIKYTLHSNDPHSPRSQKRKSVLPLHYTKIRKIPYILESYSRKCSGKKFRLCHSCFGTFWLNVCPLDVTNDNGLPARLFAIANMAEFPFPTEHGEPIAAGGLILFSFCLLLQNHTLTTSFSIHKLSARMDISSEVGLGFARKAFSKATLTLVSIDVRFFLRLPMASGVVIGLFRAPGLFRVLSASSSHFWRRGFNLHMFLKLRFRASNLDIVVCEKSLPYNLPIARPTSPWVKPETKT